MIELLVVIAIIAILAAMLLPALNGARSRARTISCGSTMTNFGKASMMYESDSGDWKPAINTVAPHASQRWLYQLRPYLGLPVENTGYVPAKMVCAGAENAFKDIASNRVGCAKIENSYGINREGYPSYAEHSAGKYRGVKNSQVHRPSQKIWMTDASDWLISYDRANAPTAYYLWGEEYSASCNNVPCYRHNDRLNIIYSDGHLGSAQWKELWDKAAGSSVYYKEKWDVTAR
ncbi:MAG: hypothetical protein HPZ91_20395 [Lentisphaeria bacterium]|nr:hypothetical protein [Lentisphaeria bacterium]